MGGSAQRLESSLKVGVRARVDRGCPASGGKRAFEERGVRDFFPLMTSPGVKRRRPREGPAEAHGASDARPCIPATLSAVPAAVFPRSRSRNVFS